jgi:hypothetical protein
LPRRTKSTRSPWTAFSKVSAESSSTHFSSISSMTFHINSIRPIRPSAWKVVGYLYEYIIWIEHRDKRVILVCSRCMCPIPETTDMNLGQAYVLASRSSTLDLWLETTNSRKLLIQGFIWLTKL